MCLGGRVKLLTMPAEEAVEAGAVTETEMLQVLHCQYPGATKGTVGQSVTPRADRRRQ